MIGITDLKLSEEIATTLNSKFWITFKVRLDKIYTAKQSDCRKCQDILLYRAQGAADILERILTIEIKNTLKDLGVPVSDAPKKY